MKKYVNLLKFSALGLIIVFLYGFAAHRNAKKTNDSVEVIFENGENLFISYETVNKLLIQKLKAYDNQSKENINLNNLEGFLQRNEMIENAEIFLTLSGELGAIITQRTPVLRVANETETYYYDKLGTKMPLSDNYSARVPLTTDTITGDGGKDMIVLSNTIRNDEFLRKQIIGIDQINGSKSNQFELKTRIGDQKIIFGDLSRKEEKIAKLKVFYQKIMLDSTISDYKTINLKFYNQIVCEK
ncbi:cell division protein FtsQ [Lutimonas saemankumensis]|uniref:cell division protein FtsQ n=1 Tax=Lutimonas saemankumensis TaxID=483016 RepID=UPI001CD70B0E|nr:cell division protein FtsQ [Lutimonas saemankumensis]MCA0933604.1 cell division protein FtsQ [Lutimonas saemankumensis]